MPKVTDVKTMPVMLVGALENLADELRTAGYTNIIVVKSITTTNFDQIDPPRALIFDHVPRERELLTYLQDEQYRGSYIPMIYYDKGQGLSDEREWRLTSDLGFSDCYSEQNSRTEPLSSFLETRLKDRFLQEEIRDNTQFIETMRADLIEVLKELVRGNDNNKRGYNPEEPADFAVAIAKELGLSKEQQDNIYIAALIGAIGQMYLADEIHEKDVKGDILGIRKIIVEKGLELLSSIPGFENILPIVWNVYENFDGVGSLYGRSGEDIPIEARVLSVGISFYTTLGNLAYLYLNKGSLFDPEVVAALVLWLEKNPGLVHKDKIMQWCENKEIEIPEELKKILL